MKTLGLVSMSALLLWSVTTAQPVAAQNAGPSVNGAYRFSLEDELIRTLEVDAWTDERGTTTGRMTFSDPSAVPDVDDPEDPDAGKPPEGFFMTANVDGLTIEKNRALVSGTVVESSHKNYVGKWVQLVVEDNGREPNIPDHLVWVFCRPRPGTWVPSDAEREFDDGAYLRWWATDAERDDDVGVPSRNLLEDERSCPVYPFFSYEFAILPRWEGDIVIQP